MSAPIARLAFIALLASLASAPCLAQSTVAQSTARERAEGDRNGSIRSLGAAGSNDRGDAKPPPVDVPPLDEGPSGTSGVPRDTVPSARRR